MDGRAMCCWRLRRLLSSSVRLLDNDSVLSKIIGGWQLSGILRDTSGQTLGVSAPQRTGRQCGRRGVQIPFGTSTFTIDGLRGFASLNEDLALAKTIRMQQGSTLQIRVEMFNAFDRVEFGSPASNIGNPETFGRITSQSNSPRNMQIALKRTF